MKNELLNYIIKESPTTLIKKIPQDVFALEMEQLFFMFYKRFIVEFNSKPTATSFSEYISKATELPDTIHPLLNNMYEEHSTEFEDSVNFYSKKLLIELKSRLLKNNMREIAKLMDDPNGLEKAEKAINTLLLQITDIENNNDEVARYNLNDEDFTDTDAQKVHPSPFKGLNALTEDGGFASPQLIVIAGQYKTNKTTFMVNLAIGYAMLGQRVLVVDTENGKRNIKKRVMQRIAEQPREKFKTGEILPNGMTAVEMFASGVKFINLQGGDIQFCSVPADTYDLSQVENEIALYNQAHPDSPITMILYDFLEQYKDRTRKLMQEQRIQAVYKDAIRINNKWNLFAFTPSHINRDGLKAFKAGETISGEHLAGALSKVADAHAIFHLAYEAQPDWEKVAGLLSEDFLLLSVVAQREGVRKGIVGFTLDIKLQKVIEFEAQNLEDVEDN